MITLDSQTTITTTTTAIMTITTRGKLLNYVSAMKANGQFRSQILWILIGIIRGLIGL